MDSLFIIHTLECSEKHNRMDKNRNFATEMKVG